MVVTRSTSRGQERPRGKSFTDVPPSDVDDEPYFFQNKTRGYWISLIFPVGFVYLIPLVFSSFSLQHIWRFHRLTRLPQHNGWYGFLLWAGHAEVLFTIYYQWLCRKAQARKTYPVRSKDELSNFILQCLSVGVPVDHDGRRPKQIDEPNWAGVPLEELPILRGKLRAWFHHAPMSAIQADNVRDWLAWAVAGGRTLEEAQSDPTSSFLVEDGLRITQRRLRWHFPPGRNTRVKVVRLTLDPVLTLWRPLGYYCVTNALTISTYIWLVTAHGFRFQSRHGLQLLVKAPSGGKSRFKMPVVFLHGLGIGLAQNFSFLKHLAKSTEGVVLLLQPGISTQIWHPRFLDPPNKEAHVAAIKEACDSIGIKRASIVSQSNGTMVHGWLLRGCKDLCYNNVLVDAVSFKLWEGDVCYAFLHKHRTTAIHLLLGYFVTREVGIAHSISRDFFWLDMLLFEHELPSVEPDRFRVILGENDALLDPKSILEYLRECGVPEESMRLLPNGQHGVSLIKEGEGMKETLSLL